MASSHQRGPGWTRCSGSGQWAVGVRTKASLGGGWGAPAGTGGAGSEAAGSPVRARRASLHKQHLDLRATRTWEHLGLGERSPLGARAWVGHGGTLLLGFSGSAASPPRPPAHPHPCPPRPPPRPSPPVHSRLTTTTNLLRWAARRFCCLCLCCTNWIWCQSTPFALAQRPLPRSRELPSLPQSKGPQASCCPPEQGLCGPVDCAACGPKGTCALHEHSCGSAHSCPVCSHFPPIPLCCFCSSPTQYTLQGIENAPGSPSHQRVFALSVLLYLHLLSSSLPHRRHLLRCQLLCFCSCIACLHHCVAPQKVSIDLASFARQKGIWDKRALVAQFTIISSPCKSHQLSRLWGLGS